MGYQLHPAVGTSSNHHRCRAQGPHVTRTAGLLLPQLARTHSGTCVGVLYVPLSSVVHTVCLSMFVNTMAHQISSPTSSSTVSS
jgi:fatty-acid desaturase